MEVRVALRRVFKGMDGNVSVSLSPYMEAFYIGGKKNPYMIILLHTELMTELLLLLSVAAFPKKSQQ